LALKLVVTVSGGLTLKPVATVSSGLASKATAMVSSGLASKPDVTVSDGLASKLAATVSDGLASKPAATVSSGLTLKSAVTVSPGLASKPVVDFLVEQQNQGGGGRVSQFGPQNQQLRFGDLGLTITATVSWFGSQNQADFGLLVAPQNRRRRLALHEKKSD
jgi:hypothetical protein